MTESNHPRLTDSMMKSALPSILASIPREWRGTTFRNSHLLGRGLFCTKVQDMIVAKDGAPVTEEDLVSLGNAEDYLRVATNIATILELTLALEKSMDISQVFTFGSKIMPLMSVLYSAGDSVVHYYTGKDGVSPFSDHQKDLLKLVGCNLDIHLSDTPSSASEAPVGIIVASDFSVDRTCVDAVASSCVLYITNPEKVSPAKILTIRKRMATPMTTPMAESRLQKVAGVAETVDHTPPSDTDVAAFLGHLQTMSGTPVDPSNNPVTCISGLAAISAMWTALAVKCGGADVLMASTAYGGSSELTDIFNSKARLFKKHKYDIQGNNEISASIQKSLDELAANVTERMPTTVLMVEIPTNPDMKVPDMQVLASMLSKYQVATGKNVILFTDTTFAPGSQVMQKMYEQSPELTTMCFISLSKSVSRGLTTGGAVVAGRSPAAGEILDAVREAAEMLDTISRPDQMRVLVKEHFGVQQRCENAYRAARAVGDALVSAVNKYCNGFQMPLAFVTPEQAAAGFHTSTFSFNLPPLPNAGEGENEALAQRFVDLLQVHESFKPCVSFGQDNGLVYATVPATSTQGAIKAEDKAKQAVGGVQLVRVSFAPTIDVDAVSNIVTHAVETCYCK